MREKKHIKEAIDTEGDINLSPRRLDWSREYIDENSQKLLLEDSKYSLRSRDIKTIFPSFLGSIVA